MGHTNYFSYNPSKVNYSPETLRKVFRIASLAIEDAFRKLSEDTGIVICGGDGFGTPFILENEICFNGSAKQGEDYETFRIYWSEDRPSSFCKTNKKPYDIFVVSALKILKETFNDPKIFDYTTD